MKKHSLTLLLGIIIGALMFGSTLTYAYTRQIDVDFASIRYFFNGVEKYPPYGMEGFIYEGRVYVPLRFMVESSGQTVVWDNYNIYVGQATPQANPNENQIPLIEQYMSDVMEPYYTSDFAINKDGGFSGLMRMGGKDYLKGYQIYDGGIPSQGKISFNLEGKYNSISGLIGVDDNNGGGNSYITFYGDDRVLAYYEVRTGELPQQLYVNVSGVSKLDIEVFNDTNNAVDLVNLKINYLAF